MSRSQNAVWRCYFVMETSSKMCLPPMTIFMSTLPPSRLKEATVVAEEELLILAEQGSLVVAKQRSLVFVKQAPLMVVSQGPLILVKKESVTFKEQGSPMALE